MTNLTRQPSIFDENRSGAHATKGKPRTGMALQSLQGERQ
jgi:hypothetical protein